MPSAACSWSVSWEPGLGLLSVVCVSFLWARGAAPSCPRPLHVSWSQHTWPHTASRRVPSSQLCVSEHLARALGDHSAPCTPHAWACLFGGTWGLHGAVRAASSAPGAQVRGVRGLWLWPWLCTAGHTRVLCVSCARLSLFILGFAFLIDFYVF